MRWRLVFSAMSVNPVSWARPQRAASSSVALPNNVTNTDRRRNQPEPWEAVGELLSEDIAIERPERELRSIDGSLLRREINAARPQENGRDLIPVLVRPCRRRRGDYVRMLGDELAIDQKE
jgi:hypothetical protein